MAEDLVTQFQDLRYGFRTVVHNLGSTTVIVLTLGLAMGTSTVIFTVINTLLQSLPGRNQSRVAYLASTDPQRGRERTGTSGPDFLDWQEQNRSFEALGALAFGNFNLSDVETPVRLSAVKASADVFAVLGIEPTLGRIFRREEDRPGGAHVALLTNRFWRRHFGARPDALGETLRLDAERYTIVGVLPSSLDAGVLRQVDVWVPLAIDVARSPRDRRSLAVFGRLKPGVARQAGAADIAAIARRLQRLHPATNTGTGAVVEPVIEAFGGGSVRFIIGLSMLMAALLVTIACANVANVILARLTGRRRELAVRTAVGASRFRLVRLLMIENLVLSVLGAATGLLLCAWEVDAVKTIAGRDMPIFSEMTVDRQVLLFALLMSVVAPLVFGLLPAVRSSAREIRDGLKEASLSMTAGRQGRRLRNVLVACQVALALTLLVEVGLLVRTTLALRNLEKGFESQNLLTLRIELPASKYASPRQVHEFFDELLSRLGALPGVQSVGAISRLPIADREVPARFIIEGRAAAPEAQPWAAVASVSPAYRATMKIPLVQGRDLTPADSADAPPTALVSRLAARRYWPRGDPIGQRIRLENTDIADRWVGIVGVVGDVRNSDPDAGLIPQIYLPQSQLPERSMAVIVRSDRDAVALTGTIRARVAELDKDQPIYDVATMEQVLFDDLASTYILTGMMVALALIALGLAAAGIYGVISYAVTQRAHEIGIRMALGAEAAAVHRMMAAQSLTPVVAGACIGLAVGLGLVRLTANALHEVNPAEPVLYVGVVGLLGAVAALASYLPARRATRIDPVAALRADDN